jgi:hypothetical protein
LLANVDLVQDPRLGVHPPEPDAGGEYFRERPQVDDPVRLGAGLLLECGYGRQRLPLETQHPVRVIFEDDHVELAGYL